MTSLNSTSGDELANGSEFLQTMEHKKKSITRRNTGEHTDSGDSTPNTDYASTIRKGLLILTLGFGGFLVWASLAPLDEGVPTVGAISIESKRKRIEHLTGGIVEHIAVKDGQSVKAGEPLITLNKTQSQAALNARLSQWSIATATVARLEAERDALTHIVFPKELLVMVDSQVKGVLIAQRDLFRNRRQSLHGDLSSLTESVKGIEHQLKSMRQLQLGREKQIELLTEQLGNFKSLSSEGFVSRNQILDLEQRLADTQSKQGEDLSNTGALQARLVELHMRQRQRLLDYQKEVGIQLAEAKRDQAVKAEELNASKDSHDHLIIRSPVNGIVVDMGVSTLGGVVKPGDRLMDVVPESADLVVQAQLPPQYIDRVYPQLPVDVHFDSYVSMLRRPVLHGHVEWVSADVVQDERTGAPYYKLQVHISSQEIQQYPHLKLLAGMQCTVLIKTGERSLMNYLLRPLLKSITSSMTET